MKKTSDMVRGRLPALLGSSDLVIVCGPGGVGKTTVSACLAVIAVSLGRRTRLLTIDPARRLADVLGLSLEGDLKEVLDFGNKALEVGMLDRKAALERLISRKARTSEERDGILSNRFYDHLASSLAGVHEYVAMEEVEFLMNRGGQDLLIVDTPPSSEANAFLDAPSKLKNVLDDPAFRTLVKSFSGVGRLSLKGFKTSSVAFRAFSAVLGSEFLKDLIMFITLFDRMLDGFRAAADSFLERLQSPGTKLVCVTVPTVSRLEETERFVGSLVRKNMSPAMVIVNRIMPRWPAPAKQDEIERGLRSMLQAVELGARHVPALAGSLAGNWSVLHRMCSTQDELVHRLVERSPCPVATLPDIVDPSGSIPALERLAAVMEEVS